MGEIQGSALTPGWQRRTVCPAGARRITSASALACAPSCEGAKAGLSRLSPQPAAAGLHPMSLAGGSPMMTRMVGAAFARHRLGRSSRGLSTCVPPIIREFVPAYALPAIRSRAHPLRACGRSCGAGGDPGIRCFFIFHEAGPSTCYGLKCLACSPPPFAWTQLAHHHCALPTRKREPDSSGTLRPPVRIACVPCSAFFMGRPLSCAAS